MVWACLVVVALQCYHRIFSSHDLGIGLDQSQDMFDKMLHMSCDVS